MAGSNAGLSIVDQYASRRQRVKESWAWHLLFAMAPFCVLIWGPPRLVIPACIAYGVMLAIGAWRQTQIDRCPACAACRVSYSVLGRRYRPDPHDCDFCGVNLVPRRSY